MTRHVVLSLAAVGLLLAGCGGRSQSAAKVPLRSIDAPGLGQVIKEHRGQVVLVHFWATWCGPCVKLFPHAAELQHRFRDRGLAVVTVSLDDPADREAVGRFLADKGPATENFSFIVWGGARSVHRVWHRRRCVFRTCGFTTPKASCARPLPAAARRSIRNTWRPRWNNSCRRKLDRLAHSVTHVPSSGSAVRVG